MCSLDYDVCDVWAEHERVARTPHRCSSCWRVIYVTERYVVHFSVYAGSAVSGKLCHQCKAIRASFSDAHEGMIPLPSALASTLEECIAEGDGESETRWRPMLNEIMEMRASRC